MHQDTLDLRALEWRIRGLQEQVASVEDGARGLLEGIGRQNLLAAAASSSSRECDSQVSVIVTGCEGLPIWGAHVTAISPATGEIIVDGYTDSTGLAVVCGFASEGGILLDVAAVHYAPFTTVISLPRAPGAGTVGVALTAGQGYAEPPLVTFSASPGGRTAAGYARLQANGLLQDVVITDAGTGYGVTAPTVTFTDAGTGTTGGASAYAILGGSGVFGRPATGTVTMDANGQIASFTLSDGGAGYRFPPVVNVVTGPLVDPYRVPVVRATAAGGAVTGFVALDPGAGVGASSTLALSISLPGGAPGASSPAGAVAAVVVTDPGRTYACVGDCGAVIYDGILTDPSGATGRVALSGSALMLFATGTVAKDWAGGQYGCNGLALATTTAQYGVVYMVSAQTGNATATANRTGSQVTSCTVGAPGFGYFTGAPPSVVIDPPTGPSPVQALAHATIDPSTGAVTGIVMDNVGNGYAVTPLVHIGVSPRTEITLTVLADLCSVGAGFTGAIWPLLYTNPSTGEANVGHRVPPSSVTCDPYTAAYDFTGTVLDGTVFQGTSKVVTIQGV